MEPLLGSVTRLSSAGYCLMRNAFRAYGDFVVRFRYIILAAWAVFAVIAFTVFPSIGSVTKDQNSGFLPNNSPSIKAEHLAAPWANIDLAQITLVASRSSGALTPSDEAAISAFESKINGLPHVVRIQDYGMSRDGRARQAQIEARVPLNGTGSAATLVRSMPCPLRKSRMPPIRPSWCSAGRLSRIVSR